MYLPGSRGQSGPHPSYWGDGTIASAALPQLVFPQRQSCSQIILQNLSAHSMNFDWGVARATATLTNGVVTSISIVNGGFGFTLPPLVYFLGGGASGVSGSLAVNLPGGASPQNVAQGVAVLTSGAVSSVKINNGGSGYLTAPYILFQNDARDPFGCVSASASSGILLPTASAPFILTGTSCFTDPISVFCGTTTSAFTARYMD